MKLLLLVSSLVVVLVGGVGWHVARRWVPAWGPDVVWVAAGLNLVACWMSFVPIAVVHRKKAEYLPQAALAAMAARFLIAAFGLLALMTFGPWDTFALSIWTVVFYLSLLVVETVATIRLQRRAEVDTPGGASS